MDYTLLRNFGELFTPRTSMAALIAAYMAVPRDLEFVGTPQFTAILRSKDEYWRKKEFETAAQRGFTRRDFIDPMRYSLAFYDALLEACGEEKTTEIYPKFAQSIGVMIFEEFMPAAEDFLHCPDPWVAIRQYFGEFFQAYERAGGMRHNIVQDTDSEFRVHVTDCPWEFICREAGYPDLPPITGQAECTFLTQLMSELGGDFKRESWLCRGDPTCDWHFWRPKDPD